MSTLVDGGICDKRFLLENLFKIDHYKSIHSYIRILQKNCEKEPLQYHRLCSETLYGTKSV